MLPEKGVEFSARVKSDPVVRPDGQIYFSGEMLPPYSGSFRLYARSGDVAYGDLLKIKGQVEMPREERADPVVFAKNISVEGNSGSYLLKFIYGLKHSFSEKLGLTLGSADAALVRGLVLGDSSGFTQEFRSEMIRSGTTHLVALSGYNVGVVIMATFGILLGRTSRRSAVWLTLLAIIFFVLMVGAEASVLRAAVMASAGLLAREAGRFYSFGRAVVFSAFLMCLWNPFILFTAGFLLSFSSLLGLAYLSPYLDDALRFMKPGLRNGLVPTLAAQVAALPVALSLFGSFSATSFFANVLILPLVPYTMLAGSLFAVLNFIMPALSFPLAWLLKLLLGTERLLISVGAKLSFSPWSGTPSWLWLSVYCFVLGLLIFKFHGKES